MFIYVVTYPVKIIKLKANHNYYLVFVCYLFVVTYPVKIIKLKANHNREDGYTLKRIGCNLSRKNNKIESESQLLYRMKKKNIVVTYPVKIIKLKANQNII